MEERTGAFRCPKCRATTSNDDYCPKCGEPLTI
jgi:rRNA maturation protein Nop10